MSLTIALVGQPNSGKSTIFSLLSGVMVRTSNFPGTTVTYSKSSLIYKNKKIEIVDLPGIYSFFTGDLAEKAALDFILNEKVDLIVNVIDASVLSRSLELTIELSDLQIPMILVLNMMDEAKKKGVKINSKALEEILGVPVVETIASRGVGIKNILERLEEARVPRVEYRKELEEFLKIFPSRREAILCLKGLKNCAHKLVDEFKLKFGDPYSVLSDERHRLTLKMFESVAKVERREIDWREKLDRIFLHPVAGFISMFFFLSLIFFISFYIGNTVSELIEFEFEIVPESILETSFKGFLDGILAIFGIVMPYLIPLLLMLSIFEDLGYLSRIAIILDRIFHRIGLHGKTVVSFVIGYGCSVPAVMSARILEDPKDRIKASILVPMIPCSARTVVVLAIVASIFGFHLALALYLLNLVVVIMVGAVVHKILKGGEIGMVMEVPPIRIPSVKAVLGKVKLVLYDFFIYAAPLIVLGNIVLSILEFYGFEVFMIELTRPLTSFLKLPEELGVPMIFGIFAKELALLMTLQVFDLKEASEVLYFMSSHQILAYVVFIMFYIPCISTISILIKEIRKYAVLALILSFLLALILSSLITYSSILWDIIF